MKTDCLIVGFNDTDFSSWVEMIKSMGETSGAFRDLNLAYIDYQEKPYRSMDLLNKFYFGEDVDPRLRFSNTDFLWPTITYLGTFLHRRGFTFDYINQFHLKKEELKQKLLHDDILTIAVTTTLYVSPHPILEIISFIRKYNEKVKILVGGPYASNHIQILDEEGIQQLFKYIGADIYVISHEGETALVNLLSALKTGSSLDKVDNLAYRSNGHYVFTTKSTERNDLAENMVDYSLFPREHIGEFVSLRTAKSCPFSCSFCGFPQRAGKYIYTGVELVENELDRLKELGVTTLTFLDDTFNVPKPRFKDILRLMIRKEYGFRWNSFYRSDHGDEETIELMGRAGCEGVFLGIESGSDRMLQRMNKTSRRHNYLKAIPLLKQAGISTHANVIVGFPGETLETHQETISLIEEARPDFFRGQLWYCDPVTPIWNHREEYGVQGSGFSWSHNTMDCDTACDLVDRLFLAARDSIWLPQNGFEQWSTFYLQRKGMSMAQLKTFLRCFNAAIREKLLHPGKAGISPALMESLAASCRFSDPAVPDMTPIEVYSAAGYLHAEQAWQDEFRGSRPAPGLEGVLGPRREGGAQWRSVPVGIQTPSLQAFARSAGTQLPHLLLGAWGTLLSRVSGQDSAVLVVGLSGRELVEVFPVRLSLPPSASFLDLLQQTGRKMALGKETRAFAFHTLKNPYRMAECQSACPTLDLGYFFSDTAPGDPRAPLEELMSAHPDIEREMGLVLCVHDGEAGPSAELVYLDGPYSRLNVEDLAASLAASLHQIVEKPESSLRDIALGAEADLSNGRINADAKEAFNF